MERYSVNNHPNEEGASPMRVSQMKRHWGCLAPRSKFSLLVATYLRDDYKIIALLWLAFALRLYRLDAQSIWWDEGISLHLANSSLAEIVSDRAANIHPPLYFFALKGWVALAGSSAFGARFFSVGASLLQVALVFGVARRWFGRPTAWIDRKSVV